MIRRGILLGMVAALAALSSAPAAQAAFGFEKLDMTFENADGTLVPQAGAHPFQMSTTIAFNTKFNSTLGIEIPDGEPRDLVVGQVPGFVGDPFAVPTCSTADFALKSCPVSSQVGTVDTEFQEPGFREDPEAVYNLAPSPGTAASLGWHISAANVPITLDARVNESHPSNVVVTLTNIPNVVPVYESKVILWGVPAASSHDSERKGCGAGGCAVNIAKRPFLTTPRSCTGPLATTFAGRSWEGAQATGSALTHDEAVPPAPLGMTGCGKLGFEPEVKAEPTAKTTTSPTGLDFTIATDNPGLTSPEGLSNADIDKAVVTLPEGFTANPALAEGLNVCTEAQFNSETPFGAPGEGPTFTPPGAGCPDASKIGTVEVETPILEDQVLKGSLFIAKPYENPFSTLLALYMTIKDPGLGVVVKVPLKVTSDPRTGQLTTTGEDLPQFPVSRFSLRFREGTRSPLATPPGCGTHAIETTLYPSSGAAPLESSSPFGLIAGPGGGPCPSGATPPFKPELVAGTLNNAAATYSPFVLRLARSDGEQEFTRFSIKLPPGIVGKLAGIPFCAEEAIAAAKARTGPHGGAEELANPSCPAASEVGRTLVGAGVGPSLAYAPGKVYLAGPYHGSALSIVAITAAKVGPFDLGTVVIREALEIDSETAEVFIDSTGSDPIPHIIKGIPVHARDIRAYVDRPQFMLNPTSCARTSTASTVLGSGADFASSSDDRPFTVTSPFQAADCASLGFKPRLSLSLKGGTRRGQNPAFKAVLRARPGDANIDRAQVTLPHSEFLDQAHIRTICTRVQFRAGAGNGAECPPGSIYGYAKAITPLLDDPVQGPVILRSSSNPLPDLVAALHNGQIDFNLVGRIDSFNGGIRNTFETVPDVPVKTFTLTMRGGKKGLLENSTNLCAKKNRASAEFSAQNGKRLSFRPLLRPSGCKKARKGKAKRHRRR